MPRLSIGAAVIVILLVIIATVLTVPSESTKLQQLAAIFLGILAGIGTIAEVIGLIRHFRPHGKQGPASTPTPLPPLPLRGQYTGDKLDRLHRLSDCPYVLVGSVYLDVMLYPITTTILDPMEWSNVDPIRLLLGGSSVWVGRYLWDLYGQKSYLLSTTGTGVDPLTKEFDRLITRERSTWLQNKLVTGPRNSCTGVTIHLVQENKTYTTMFTHRGTLRGFGWTDIEKQLNKILAQGGVVYIGGYMKTSLWSDLRFNLERIYPRALICIDHGRLTPELTSGYAARALRNAFQMRLVDVYFCTYKELADLYEYSDRDPTDAKKVESNLRELADRVSLPTVTIVRDPHLPGETKAYVIVERSVEPLREQGGPRLISSQAGPVVGPINAFNAAMMYEMVRGPRCATLEDLVIQCGNASLRYWRNTASILDISEEEGG